MDEKRKIWPTCTTCLKRFPTPSQLERHMLTHSGEKPFICNTCGRKFTQKSHLNRHLQDHEDNLICSICLKKSPSQSELLKHKEGHQIENIGRLVATLILTRFSVSNEMGSLRGYGSI